VLSSFCDLAVSGVRAARERVESESLVKGESVAVTHVVDAVLRALYSFIIQQGSSFR
jgi:hypothetical protein